MEFPNYFKHVRPPTPESNVPTQISETRGLNTLARKIPSQRWEFTFNGFTYNTNCGTVLNSETRRFFGEFVALAQNGFGVFDFKINEEFTMRPGIQVTLLEDIAAKDDEFLIGVPDFQDNADNDIVSGKMFKFVGHDKVYMITSAVSLGVVNNNQTYRIKINTGVFQPVNTGGVIIADNALRIKLRVDGPVGRGVTSDIIRDKTVYQFKMIEVI
jgi:hypothetical protein